MMKIVGFAFGAAAGLVAAAWLYGGATSGPGFTARDAVAQEGAAPRKDGAPPFKLSGEPAPPAAGDPPREADASAPNRATAPGGGAAPAFNTGGNADVDAGAGPNWGLGFGLGGPTNGQSTDKRGEPNRPK